ncbi:class I SAM-dependent methyltransferase [Gelidibacter mesophilus]|uniref:class I SAM-dependent methyltransferase n=1 Tax=Gelidibacter mesophilus TaxID=169050 RepID=UPI000415CBBF|nr:class I SAM-dependent methyltransferase [Gelidibacter mesophilus]
MSEYNSSYIGLRPDLIKYIPVGNHIVLDVGCALGVNGRYLLEHHKAKEVYGVEYDNDMAKEAAQHNTKVWRGDLNKCAFLDEIMSKSSTFDYILFGDVLEHLYDPYYVLKHLVSKLKPNGQVIISLPNIAHIELFIQIYIKGTWPRNERGIFDKTHLRWFTRKDVYSLVSSANLKVLTYERKYRSRDAMGSKFNWKAKVLKFLNKDLVTFQHIIVCQHA